MKVVLWGVVMAVWAVLFYVSNDGGQKWALLFPGLILTYGFLYEVGGIIRSSCQKVKDNE